MAATQNYYAMLANFDAAKINASDEEREEKPVDKKRRKRKNKKYFIQDHG